MLCIHTHTAFSFFSMKKAPQNYSDIKVYYTQWYKECCFFILVLISTPLFSPQSRIWKGGRKKDLKEEAKYTFPQLSMTTATESCHTCFILLPKDQLMLQDSTIFDSVFRHKILFKFIDWLHEVKDEKSYYDYKLP
jgi:hypothetical protein